MERIAEGEPRALTPDEARDLFLKDLSDHIDFWASDERKESPRERLEGLAMTLCGVLDGKNCGGLPAYSVIPLPHPSDRDYDCSHGHNFYPEPELRSGLCDIAGRLQENFYRVIGERQRAREEAALASRLKEVIGPDER